MASCIRLCDVSVNRRRLTIGSDSIWHSVYAPKTRRAKSCSEQKGPKPSVQQISAQEGILFFFCYFAQMSDVITQMILQWLWLFFDSIREFITNQNNEQKVI